MSAHILSRFQKGVKGEDLIRDHLIARGFKILAKNVREKLGEIDIVAMDGETLCFVEVRTRKGSALGHPAETVSVAKQQRIRRAAEAYLARRGIKNRCVRFDVATVVWSSKEINYFENAF